MPVRTIKDPGGSTYQVNAPEGASDSDIMDFAYENDPKFRRSVDVNQAKKSVLSTTRDVDKRVQLDLPTPEAMEKKSVLGKVWENLKAGVQEAQSGTTQLVNKDAVSPEQVRADKL